MRRPVNIGSGSRFAIALCLALVGNPLMAGGDDSGEFSEAQSQREVDYECSCSIRKRQQVKARLEKRKSRNRNNSETRES